MWPSMWIFDRCACFPYLHPSHTLFLSHYLHLPVFLSLSFFPPSIVRFQEFPLGVAQVLRPKQKGVLFFPSSPVFFVLPPPDQPDQHIFHLKTFITKYSSLVSTLISTLKDGSVSPQWLSVHLRSDSLTSLLIMIFDLPADHGTSSSSTLPQKPQETGSCDTVVCAAMERPITAVTWQVSTGTDATMWALFSNKLQLPWGPWEFHTGHGKCLKMHGRYR